MEALDAIMTRRSIRGYSGEPVSDDEIQTVLRAAMAAPSAHNHQPWRFVVVRDRETLERLSQATPWAKPLAKAEAGLVVCAEPGLDATTNMFWPIDCSAAIENALLAVHALGLGAVWIGVHPIAPFAGAVRRAIGAPRKVRIHSMVAIGRPREDKPAAERYEAEWVHQERW